MDDFAQLQAHLEQHDRRFDEHDRRFDEHDRRFDEHDKEFKALRQEIQEFREEIRQELKSEVRGLHLRFERLEDTMKLVAERVSEFNRETGGLRTRVTHLETSQVNNDLRLVALERKQRKS